MMHSYDDDAFALPMMHHHQLQLSVRVLVLARVGRFPQSNVSTSLAHPFLKTVNINAK
jgi:hypothetical protein